MKILKEINNVRKRKPPLEQGASERYLNSKYIYRFMIEESTIKKMKKARARTEGRKASPYHLNIITKRYLNTFRFIKVPKKLRKILKQEIVVYSNYPKYIMKFKTPYSLNTLISHLREEIKKTK